MTKSPNKTVHLSQLIAQFELRTATPLIQDFEVRGVAPLSEAGSGDLSFLSNPKYKKQVVETKASAILLQEPVEGVETVQLLCQNPYVVLARILAFLYEEPKRQAHIHPTAIIASTARVSSESYIGPYCTIGEHASIAAGVTLHSHVTIGENCQVGSGSVLFPHVVLYPHVIVGDHVRIHSNSSIGGDGFGYALDAGKHLKVPQISFVQIENHVEIGANVSIDRGALSPTQIGEGTKIDNQVQIGHGVKIGPHCIIVGQVGISGSSTLGHHTVLAGQVGVVGHIHIGHEVVVMGDSIVTKSIHKPGKYAGNPAVPYMKYQRQNAYIRKIPQLLERVNTLEKLLNKEES